MVGVRCQRCSISTFFGGAASLADIQKLYARALAGVNDDMNCETVLASCKSEQHAGIRKIMHNFRARKMKQGRCAKCLIFGNPNPARNKSLDTQLKILLQVPRKGFKKLKEGPKRRKKESKKGEKGLERPKKNQEREKGALAKGVLRFPLFG